MITDRALSLAAQGAALAAARGRLVRLAEAAIAARRKALPGLPPERVLEALGRVTSLGQDVWDLDPSLAPCHLDSELVSDLDRLFGLLETGEPAPAGVRDRIVAIVLAYAPESVAGRVRPQSASGAAEAALRRWWASTEGMLRMQGALEQELRSSRRWRRISAAAALRKDGGPDLMDANGADLDEAARDRWCRENREPPLRLIE